MSTFDATPAQEAEFERLRVKFGLDATERDRLGTLEAAIGQGLEAFVEVGRALAEIRDSRLYRESHKNFADYCRERWGVDRTYAHRQIQAAEVAALLPIGNKPTNEAQVRELVPLKDDPAAVVEVWAEVQQRGVVTAKAIRESVEGRVNGRPGPGTPQWPVGTFPLIYADPPWRYEHNPSDSRAIERHYPTMELDEIKALGVPAADNAVLFLWAPSPKLEEALEVVRAWGFQYRTNLVWDKEQIGMGYWVRQQHEQLLIAKRGDIPRPAAGDRPPSILRARRGRHSEKPAEAYELIERMYPELPKLELFARTRRPGWTAWGNEVEAVSA